MSGALRLLTCLHFDEDDDGVQIAASMCGQPATHYACTNGPRAQVRNACEAHKCRCPQPLPQRGTNEETKR